MIRGSNAASRSYAAASDYCNLSSVRPPASSDGDILQLYGAMAYETSEKTLAQIARDLGILEHVL